MASLRCSGCGSRIAVDAKVCDACGTAQEPRGADALDALMIERLRSARAWILAVGGLYAASGLLFFAIGGGSAEARVVLAVNLALAAIHVGLWAWARSAPFAAALVALVLFVTLHLASAVLEPATILQGIPVKIFFVLALGRAISTALYVKRLRADAAAERAVAAAAAPAAEPDASAAEPAAAPPPAPPAP